MCLEYTCDTETSVLAPSQKQKQQQLKLSDHMAELTFPWKWKWTVIKPNCTAYRNYHYSCSFLIFLGLNTILKSLFTVGDLLQREMSAASLFRSPEIFRDSVFLAHKHFWFVMVLWKPALVVTCWSRRERCNLHVCSWHRTHCAYLLVRRNNDWTMMNHERKFKVIRE